MGSTLKFDLEGITNAEDGVLVLREFIDIQFRNAVKAKVKVSDIQETLVSITPAEEDDIMALATQILAVLNAVERASFHRQAQIMLNEWPERFASDGIVTRPQQHDTMVFMRLSESLSEAYIKTITQS